MAASEIIPPAPPSETSDLLYGARAIATFLGMREKQVRNRIDQNLIPTFRLGGTVCARKSRLAEWIGELEAGRGRTNRSPDKKV